MLTMCGEIVGENETRRKWSDVSCKSCLFLKPKLEEQMQLELWNEP